MKEGAERGGGGDKWLRWVEKLEAQDLPPPKNINELGLQAAPAPGSFPSWALFFFDS